MERTYVMIKPDGVQRNLVGEITSRLEKKGLKIVGLKMLQINRELAERHYEEHRGKSFFEPLVEYITSCPVVAMALEGKDAVGTVREMMGATNPLAAALGTIRGDFGMDIGRNIVHSSDSPESAARELNLFFAPGEIVEYRRALDSWIYE
ncbi:Nucleoside diphosphate kinase [Sporotomaculum syntrophicum]|uniref:Nucleoside diphosphate kinase n=1 Tax=Sporotomaculum syntrophicum TaxID=182264 RepID=A0A9D3AY90_9FIRM|nr:nucleoside-diphosphate kinase [Sporotomaculum syntrophicum]KAF1085812.1 Nucleoside diphosphate kinase [Sporotomaculum syntrophicum]